MIKTLVKILGIILILLLLCVAGGVTFLYVKFPKMEPPAQITAQATPQPSRCMYPAPSYAVHKK